MKAIVLDFETYYDDEYSLRKMTPIEYVLDPRFECHGCAVSNYGISGFLEGDLLSQYLKKLPAQVAVISHNALFDMTVLAHRFHYVPALMIDTLGMARAWWNGHYKSYALGALGEIRQCGQKLDTIAKVKGMSLAAIKANGLMEEYARYSCNDATIAFELFVQMLGEGFPKEELLIQDTVLRCAIEPKFVLNQQILAEHLHQVQAEKQALLDRIGMSTRDELMSNEKFAAMLQSMGVAPPRKISKATGMPTWAFAKTDEAFAALLEHDDPDVQALVAARMGIKSTLEETRTQRFIKISQVTWPGKPQARLMPVPLRYGAAHTHRLGGEWDINMQNLARRSPLRKALEAPEGHVVVKADSSQVEARGVSWLTGAHELTRQFAAGEDVYASFAARVFGYAVDKKTHPLERFIGKTAILSLGYGAGGPKFGSTIRLKSKQDLGKAVEMDDVRATEIVTTYRTVYSPIPAGWQQLGALIPAMTHENCDVQWGPVQLQYQRIKLPSGLYLYYHDLEENYGEWSFRHGKFRNKKIYGGKLLENITQALARIIVMDAAARVRARLTQMRVPAQLNLQAHDELVYIAPTECAADVRGILDEEMRRGSGWSDGWPLDCESNIVSSYGG